MMFGLGSSPRARGTLVAQAVDLLAPGIIPACAGNTSICEVAVQSKGDHPRVRGEHMRIKRNFFKKTGSSPRARGTPLSLFSPTSFKGIIPACAGNTCCAGR